jgi:hypothetical protein
MKNYSENSIGCLGVFITFGAAVIMSTHMSVAATTTRVCRGIITVNWTEGVSDKDSATLDNTFLIRADNINDSCLVRRDSTAGKKVLAVCWFGYPCKARVTINDEDEADVFIVHDVLTVEPLATPRHR